MKKAKSFQVACNTRILNIVPVSFRTNRECVCEWRQHIDQEEMQTQQYSALENHICKPFWLQVGHFNVTDNLCVSPVGRMLDESHTYPERKREQQERESGLAGIDE